MKKIGLLLVLLISCLAYSCLSGEPGGKDGIKFFEGGWEAALQKAKAEHKPIFMDIYATWCGPCKLLKKNTFVDKAVADYYNANYINLSFDGENGEGVMLAQKFQITGYPTLIILSPEGTLVKMQAGFLPPDDFLAFGKQ
ncbi:MAG: hypothetical protein K0Q79_3363 [Flavipsychrobacter sp.]|jgi:uncharacterized protein YyaL (SSP411 family)|nr:hypothetical protein [Flavipsychrobacter sp.]